MPETNRILTTKSIWPFSPQSIAGCVLWLDASDTNSIDLSGTSVTQWNDKSGKGNNATSSYPPTYMPGVANGLGLISFDGASNYFDCPLTVDFSSHCLFAVHIPQTTDSWYPPYLTGGNTRIFSFQNTNGYIVFPYTFDGQPGGIYNNGGNYVNDHGSIWTELPDNPIYFCIATANISSGNSATYTNGTLNGSTTNTITPGQSDTLSIGAFGVAPYQQQYYWGEIAELIVFSRNLMDEERQQVEGYLKWKWGPNPGNLPTNHPYFSRPVFNRIFQPVDISGCSLWLDAADESTITLSGSSVTQWNDKSGNGFVATPLDNAVTKTTLNGNTALNFGGNRMTIPDFTWNMSFTSIIVWNAYYGSQMIGLCESTASNAAWQDYISTGNWGLIMLNNNATSSTDPNYIRGPDDYWPGAPAPIVTGNQWFIFSIGYTAGTTTITNYAVNGSARTANAVSAQTGSNTGVYFINGLANGAYDTSQVAEIIHYNTSLTTSQREQVEAYLAWKWKLQSSLPNTHPGYTLPAFSVPFNLKSIPHMALWLDASDTSTITGNGYSIPYKIADKSGSANLWEINTNLGNSYLQLGNINNLQALQFQNSFLSGSYTLTRGYNVTIFAVANVNPSNSLSVLKNDGPGFWFIPNNFLDFTYGPNGDYQYYTDNAPAIPSDNNNYILCVTLSATDSSSVVGFSVNGTVYSTAQYGDPFSSTGNTTFTSGMTGVGDGNGDFQTSGALIGEVIVFSYAVTDTQRQQIEGQLAWKWRLQNNLPSTHPYKKHSP